jgi:hypothetical protein
MPTIQPARAAYSALRLATLERRLVREAGRAHLPSGPGPMEPVTNADLAPLPVLVQRYLRFMGVAGRPRDWSFRLHWEGRVLYENQWVPCRAAQYDQNVSVARIVQMRLPVGGLIPTYVRDTYVQGRGHLRGKAFDAFAVSDDAGERTSTGELVAYLNDCLFLAPSMLLVPEVTWRSLDDTSFEVALTDSGRTVKARVHATPDGVPMDFSTMDRFYVHPGKRKEGPVETEWRTPVDAWQSSGGRAFPTHVSSVWVLPEGPLTTMEMTLDPRAITFNVAPGE